MGYIDVNNTHIAFAFDYARRLKLGQVCLAVLPFSKRLRTVVTILIGGFGSFLLLPTFC